MKYRYQITEFVHPVLVTLFLVFTLGIIDCTSIEPYSPKNEEPNEPPSEEPTEETEITKVKLLAIGNSFSEDALEYYLHGLSHANGDTIIIGNLYIGGASLETHYKNSVNNAPLYSYRKIVNGEKTIIPDYTILDAIKEERWDYISFQQVSSLSGIYESFFPYLTSLIRYVEEHTINPDVEFVLHSTWAYAQNSTHEGFVKYGNDQMKMYNVIIDTYQNVAEEIGVDIIIPAGTAIQNGRTSTLGDTFCRDGYHLEPNYGRYTASCAWYEKIFRKTVVGNSYIPNNISKFQADVAQSAAHFAVQNPYEVTELVDFKENPEIKELTKPVYIDFGNKLSPFPWNNVTSITAGSSIELIDEEGTELGMKLVIKQNFGGINGNGPVATQIPGFDIPETASSDSFFGNLIEFSGQVSPQTEMEITGLNPEKKYDFLLFGSRTASDNRETKYTVKGYNEEIVYLNASSNTTLAVSTKGIKPLSNGSINIIVTYGPNNNNANKFYYINSMKLSPGE